ncbi:DUF6234 family protein [Streptomyces sp. NPDC050600]|uniref:DUF6234 family protein n=1 Tax=unclassified Streptomyces TaxID=2593676 RepID=UPI00342DCC1D
MSDTRSSRHRSVGEDVLVAVVLWVLDAIAGTVVLLTGLGSVDYNIFEPDPQASLTPVYAYVAVFASVVMLSALGMYRMGYRVSVWAQLTAGVLLLGVCAVGVGGAG